MAKVVIVGGKLQGMEAGFLGMEAGFETVMIDKNPFSPAQKMCTRFICADVLSDDERVRYELDTADMILPAMENFEVLEGLVRLSEERGYILAFDMEAYKVSRSKLESDRLFAENGLPCPQYYPKGTPPFIAKPVNESGSHGIKKLNTMEEASYYADKGYIVQEFVEGPSYSMEVIGEPGNYRTYAPTEIFVDENYDCCLAAAYRDIEESKVKRLQELIVYIAESLKLKGIMDLEVIDVGDELKILEIDARIPSQTSIAVYYASGMNYVSELYDLFVKGGFKKESMDKGFCSYFTQAFVEDGSYRFIGEHIMTEGGILNFDKRLSNDGIGISDRNGNRRAWRATMIGWAEDFDRLMVKTERMHQDLDVLVEGQNERIYSNAKAEAC